MSLKKNFWLIAALILIACAPSAGVTAESQVEPDDATKMNIEDLMNATIKGASKFEQPLNELDSSFSIITAQDIKKYGYRTLAEILQSQRSMLISNDRNYTYAGMRGFGRTGDYSTRILLLVDGHRTNENIFDSGYYGYEFVLDVDLIDRVEIIRGPSSSLYGSNAFYGIINVITRKGRDLKGVEVSGGAGTFNTYDGRMSYGNRYSNGLEVMLSGSVHDSRGDQHLYYPDFDQREHPGEPMATDNGIAHDLDYEHSTSLFSRISLKDVTLEAAFVDRKKGIPTAPYGAWFDRNIYTVDRRGFVELKYERYMAQAGVMARGYYDHYDYYSPTPYNVADVDAPPDIVINWDEAEANWWGGELQLSKMFFNSHRVIVGGEFSQSLKRFDNHDIDPDYAYVDLEKTTRRYGLYIQDEVNLLDNLILNAGLRYDDDSTSTDNLSPRVMLIYKPFRKTTLKASYGEAFRAPNFFELYYSYPDYQKGNTGLKPEKIRSYEAMLEQMIGEQVKLSVCGFYMESKDHIVQETDPSDGLLIFENVKGEKSSGIEVELEGKWPNGRQGLVSYSYQDARDRDTDRWLENSPRHLLRFNLIEPLYADKLFAGTEVRYMSERKTKAAHSGDVTLVNLTLFGQRLLQGLEVSASVYNLFDRKWSEPANADQLQDEIPMDRRTIRVKLTYLY